MHGGFLLQYTDRALSPNDRLRHYIATEPRLTWAGFLRQDLPEAELFLVGGTVRDILLGRHPSDIDLVIRGVDTETIQAWLLSHGACELAGKRFGTFKFIPHGQGGTEPIDIALPRTEMIGPDHASGRSDLEVTSDPMLPIEDDLSRRDLTINAIAYNVARNTITDPYDGLRDLRAGIIRAVRTPSHRFYEDATRMLRALRFASSLRFSIAPMTWHAIKESIHLLNQTIVDDDGHYQYHIPRELIGREFLLGFVPHPVHTLHLWEESGALELFFPDIHTLKSIHEGDESLYERLLRLLHTLKSPQLQAVHGISHVHPSVLIAALSLYGSDDRHQTGYRMCRDLYFHQLPAGHNLHVDCKMVMWLLQHANHLKETHPASLAPSEFERKYVNEWGQQLLYLIHARAIVDGTFSPERDHIHHARRLADRLRSHAHHYPKLIRGGDLKAIGVEPGPQYRVFMDNVRDLQLKGDLCTKEQAIAHIQKSINS